MLAGMRATAIMLLATIGCGPRSAPVVMSDEQLAPRNGPIVRPLTEMTCAGNVDALEAAFRTARSAWGDELRDFLRDRCLSDGWSADARDCVYAEAYPDCLARTLQGWQRDRLIGVVTADQQFDVAAVPHHDLLACTRDCAPPEPPPTPCEHAARRIVGDLVARYDMPAVPRVSWPGLAGVLVDQCRLLEWPPAAATCFGERGIVPACTDQLSGKQKGVPEVLVAMWLQTIEKRFGTPPAAP